MKILLTIKRTPHRDARMKVRDDGSLATPPDLKHEVNPFDELAVEEALRIREQRDASGDGAVETVVVTIGGEECRQQLLTALAMGVDRAIRVDSSRTLDSLETARCLAALVEKESPDLVLTGKLAVDDENGQIPSMLAALLGWPQANQASAIRFIGDRRLRVDCEVDAGIDEVELDLPAVITADLRLNEPRYASLPGIMKAKKKPMDTVPLEDILEGGEPRDRVAGYRSLPPREKVVLLDSPRDLVRALEERKLL